MELSRQRSSIDSRTRPSLNRWRGVVLAFAGAAAGLGATASAETITFDFARCGMSYSAAIFSDNPLVGRRVVSTRVVLDVVVDAGSDAQDFSTDISFPIQPDIGNSSFLVITGAQRGWNGAGTFHYEQTTTGFNGVLRAGRYGAETFGVSCTIQPTSIIEMTLGSAPCVADVDDGTGSGTPDGAVTIEDLLFYVEAWQAGDIRSDVDDGSGAGVPDGATTLEDLLFFLERFSAGC